jgi:retron-type reverse transcriptase
MTHLTLYEQLCDWQNLWSAYLNASKGKRGRPSTAEFEYLLADNLLELQAELQTQSYQPGAYHSFYIHEPKRRLISAAPFRDRVVHHALCHVTVPYFERAFIPDSYANRPGLGTHRALDQCQRFMRRNRYALQCDVVQFFPSLDHAHLRAALAALLPDASVNWLIDRVLASGQGVLAEEYQLVVFPGDAGDEAHRPRGLPIGNLTSQWWANVYLHRFDQFVKRELRCRDYVRYVVE